MQGQVFVPYTPIGGENISTYGLDLGITGSTGQPNPGGTGIQFLISWTYPGGINNTKNDGRGFWGYAVHSRIGGSQAYSYDEDIVEWLTGKTSSDRCTPSHVYSEDDLTDPAKEAAIVADINRLITQYGIAVGTFVDGSDMKDFQNAFPGCWYFGA